MKNVMGFSPFNARRRRLLAIAGLSAAIGCARAALLTEAVADDDDSDFEWDPSPSKDRARTGNARSSPTPSSTDSALIETSLPRPASLSDEAQTAVSRGEPLVLLASLPGCPYCEQVRRAYLLPLARERTGVAQIDVGTTTPVVDFDLSRSTHDAVATRLQARFTPTVMFFDDRGQELAERLIGAGNLDFYNALFEQRLAASRAKLLAKR